MLSRGDSDDGRFAVHWQSSASEEQVWEVSCCCCQLVTTAQGIPTVAGHRS